MDIDNSTKTAKVPCGDGSFLTLKLDADGFWDSFLRGCFDKNDKVENTKQVIERAKCMENLLRVVVAQKTGDTFGHYICRYDKDNLDVVAVLKELSYFYKAYINISNYMTGDTPLHVAVQNKKHRHALVPFLLEKGCDTAPFNYKGRTANSILYEEYQVIDNRNEKDAIFAIITMIDKASSKPSPSPSSVSDVKPPKDNSVSSNILVGKNPLCGGSSNVACGDTLSKSPCWREMKAIPEEYELHAFCKRTEVYHEPYIRYHVRAFGKFINKQDNEGNTPLHIALEDKNAERTLVSILLEYGADPNIGNNQLKSPFDILLDFAGQAMDIVKLMLKAGAEIKIFHTELPRVLDCIEKVKDDEVKLALMHNLLDNNQDITKLLLKNCTMSKNEVDALLSRGRSLDKIKKEDSAKSVNDVKPPPGNPKPIDPSWRNSSLKEEEVPEKYKLHWLCWKIFATDKIQKMFDHLNVHPEHINLQDEYGNTPLHYVIVYHEYRSVHIPFLISKGADVNIKNNEGDTPFHILMKCSSNNDSISPKYGFRKIVHTALIQLMLDNGADVATTNNKGENVLPFLEKFTDTVPVKYQIMEKYLKSTKQ